MCVPTPDGGVDEDVAVLCEHPVAEACSSGGGGG